MKLTATTWIEHQEHLWNLFRDKRFQRLNIYQQEKIVLELFHSVNFDEIKPENRVILLQMFENIMAKKEKRIPYTLTVLPPDWAWDTFLSDMFTYQKRIYVRRNLIENGIKQDLEKIEVKEEKIDCLNLFLLDSILHEGWHANTKEKIRSGKQFRYFDSFAKEHKEFLLRLYYKIKNPNQTQTNQEFLRNGRTDKYIANPDEYYAFLFARTYIQKSIPLLEKKYGQESSFDLYKQSCDTFEKRVCEDYYRFEKENLNYHEIYEKYLDKYMETMVCKNFIYSSFEEAKQDIQTTKSLIKKLV